MILQPPSSPQSSSLVTSILFANCLQYSNSAMNPLLYAGLSDNFRKSFRKVIISLIEACEACSSKNQITTAGLPLWPILAGSKPTAAKLLFHHSKDSSGSTVHSGASGRLLLKDGGQTGPVHPCHLHIIEVPEQHSVFWGDWHPRWPKSNNYSCCQWPVGTTSSSSMSIENFTFLETTRSVLNLLQLCDE